MAFALAWLGLLALALAPADRAAQAVRDWLSGKYAVNPMEAVGRPPEEAFKLLEKSLAFPPPPPGLEVNLKEPAVEQRGPETWVRFPAVAGEQSGEVVVRLRDGSVAGIAWRPEGGLLPGWLLWPWVGPAFVLLGFLLLFSLVKGQLRPYWRDALRLVAERRRLFWATQAGLFIAFFLGAMAAYADPRVARLLQELLGAGIGQIGLERAVQNGPLGLATVIFYWNFTRGLVLTTALPGLFFGVPALLINLARYYILGMALSPAVIPPERFLLHLPVIFLELGAYNTATFGALALLGDLLAGRGYRQGLKALGRSLVLATVLLFLAAVYEAFEVLA